MCGRHVLVSVLLWMVAGILQCSLGNDEGLLFTTTVRCGEAPQIEEGHIVERSPVHLKYQCGPEYTLHGSDTVLCFSNKSWSEVPHCEAISTPTVSDDSQWQMFTTIDICGSPPIVNDGDFDVDQGQMFVTYQCNYWYKLEGNSIVRCLNGHWTPLPTCEVDFCELDTFGYRHLVNIGNVFIKSGTRVKLSCPNSTWRTAYAECSENKQLRLSDCCFKATHKVGLCDYHQIQ